MPEEVEDAICRRLEDGLDGISHLVELRCDARENIAVATAQMTEGADIDTFYNDITSQVEAISGFPEKVEKATVVKLERTATVASIAISGKMTPISLKAYTEGVKDRIQRDARIAQVQVHGFSDQILLVEIPLAALQRYQLSLGDIRSAVEHRDLDLPAGVMQTFDGDVTVRFSNRRDTEEELADLAVISDPLGGSVRLGDIGRISTVFERPEDKVLFNGSRAAILEISKTYDQDSLKVMDAIQENLAREKKMAPPGVKLEISSDVTTNIRERLRLLVNNGVQGLILVFLCMWLFFSLRFSFWVSMGLPVSILGAVFVMQTLGYTINMMTLVGCIVALGLLMDDAIVIAENIAAHHGRGASAFEAAVNGTRQVMPGVLASFLTTAVIVGPLAFLSGKMGAVLKYIPAVLLITLLISLFEAFFVLPTHLQHAIKEEDGGQRVSGFKRWFARLFEAIRDRFFLPLVSRAITNPQLTIAILIALVLISYAVMPAGLLKYQALPNLESDIVQARVILPQGTPLERTEEVVEELVRSLHAVDGDFTSRQPGRAPLLQNISVLFNSNVDAYESGPHVATVSADLLPAGTRVGTVEEILQLWRQTTPPLADVIALKFTDRERGIAGKAVELRIQGNNFAGLKAVSNEIQDFLATFAGVEDISDDFRPGKMEYQVRLKEGASVFGITPRIVADEVRGAVNGTTNLEVLRGFETYGVTIRLDSHNRDSMTDLLTLLLPGPSGEKIPLSAVAEIEQRRGYARIHRVNGQRTVTISAGVDTTRTNAQEIMRVLFKQFLPKIKQQYPDVRFVTQGQAKETADTGNSLQLNLLLGLIGVYLLLAYQFGNYIQPLAIVLAIPMGFIGVIWGHLFMGFELTMPSLVGFATLAGIVVNDNILLMGFIRDRLAEGMSAAEAGKLSARDRFRPIVLTSLTTIAGLLPLLAEASTQAQFLRPLVASLAFGLLTATIASLFLVPSFFVLLEEMGLLKKKTL